ncbi:hypothetical protein IHE31_11920 [Mycetohabitans rhizoxinica]|uniref:hypothetical protein n=1 Tax=Mycetohabitans TaxID=2571159 RepID=UPI0002D5CAE7|nr:MULTISPECIES: hypothetical protein [Mycetohabitans]MCG1047550.1 hypothetical protein [Mycetohabitans sp. B6]
MQVVDQQRQQLIDFIARVLAQQTDKRNATRMARHCMLLLDGAIVATQTRGGPAPQWKRGTLPGNGCRQPTRRASSPERAHNVGAATRACRWRRSAVQATLQVAL